MAKISKFEVRCVRSDRVGVWFDHWVVPGLVPAYSMTPVQHSLSVSRSAASVLRRLHPIVMVVGICA